jgi:hypothetical protein
MSIKKERVIEEEEEEVPYKWEPNSHKYWDDFYLGGLVGKRRTNAN